MKKKYNSKKNNRNNDLQIIDKMNLSMSNPLNNNEFIPFAYNEVYILSKKNINLINSNKLDDDDIIINVDLLYFNYIEDNFTYIIENNEYFKGIFLDRSLVQDVDFILINSTLNEYLIEKYNNNYISIKWNLILNENGFYLDLYNYIYLNIFVMEEDGVEKDMIIVNNNINIKEFLDSRYFEKDYELLLSNPFIKDNYLNLLIDKIKYINIEYSDNKLNEYVLNNDYLILYDRNSNVKLDESNYDDKLNEYLCYTCNSSIEDKLNYIICNCNTFLFCNIDCYIRNENSIINLCKNYKKNNNKFINNLKNNTLNFNNSLLKLRNIGNTCYLNSVFQFLNLNKDIKNDIVKIFEDKNIIDEIINEPKSHFWLAIYDILLRKKNIIINPYYLKYTLEIIDDIVL